MKRWMIIFLLLCGVFSPAWAEESVLSEEDFAAIYEFAGEYGAESIVKGLMESALEGKLPDGGQIAAWLKAQTEEPLRFIRQATTGIVAPALMLALIKCMMPERSGGSTGASFVLRMMLLLRFSGISAEVLTTCADGIDIVKRFTDTVSPLITVLITATGMQGTAAMVSPAAALAGNAAEGLFLKLGLPVCRIALCFAVAGNLSCEIDLSRLVKLMKKAANWISGLAVTFFTALLALQGSVCEGLDGVAVRTAKFAFDSASPVIGSGISEAWESYVSGVMISKNAVGISGIAALFASVAKPMAMCLLIMLLLNVVAILLDAFGERETARAAVQIGGICQMSLSMLTAAVAIGTILMGAAMAAGKSLLG